MMKLPQLSNDVNRRFPNIAVVPFPETRFSEIWLFHRVSFAVKPIPQSIKSTIDKYGKEQKKNQKLKEIICGKDLNKKGKSGSSPSTSPFQQKNKCKLGDEKR